MKEIIEYKTVRVESHKQLEEIVNDLIRKYWQPTGGMFVTMEMLDNELSYPYFYQSLVLYND
jgi:hypothetical protein